MIRFCEAKSNCVPKRIYFIY